jgi:type IV pilus assembly protein PilN
MRASVPVNLASEPFRRDRPLLLAALAGVALLAGTLVMQVSLGWVERGQRSELSASIGQAQEQLAKIRAERGKVESTLREPHNAAVFDYSVFLNGLLRRKGISWTRIFDDLEGVMPYNVRLVAVRPQVDTENNIRLDMTVAAQEPQPVINMLMKLEGSPRFGATTIVTWTPPSQSEPLYRGRVNVNYAPQH